MKFHADLHMHTDEYVRPDGKRNGMVPIYAAEAITQSSLDAFAITEHYSPSVDRFHDVMEEIERLQEEYVGKRIFGVLGVELHFLDEKKPVHVGYLYKEPFERGEIPTVPGDNASLEELQQYREAFPGVAILHHPTWKDATPKDLERTQDLLIHSELFDGFELFNAEWIKNLPAESRWKMDALLTLNREAPASLARIGSSDAHSAESIGQAFTTYHAASAKGLFWSIKSGKTSAVYTACESEPVHICGKECMKAASL